MKVNTVVGPISVNQLGHVLPHEHLACDLYRVTRRSRDGLQDVESVTEDVAAFRSQGGSTIVEVTTPDLGRDPDKLKLIAEATGVNIVMGCGWYREPFYAPSMWERSTHALAEELIGEITEGINGVKPGVIGELGADGSVITPVEERAHRAAARAQVATGLPITTHAFRTDVGVAQLDLLEEEGVNSSRIAIGHCDSFPDPSYHSKIVERGAYIGVDLVRGLRTPETKRQIRMVTGLIEAGYGTQILVSHDVCFHEHLRPYGGNGYSFVAGEFASLLVKAGLSQSELEMLLETNPRRFLCGT